MAFLLEERPAREPFLRVPAVVVVLIGVLVVAYLLRAYGPAVFDATMTGYGVLIPLVYSPSGMHAAGYTSATLAEQLLPPIGHIFLHANFTHLAINCVWLLAFAPVVARRFGSFGFLLCGLAGAAAFVAIMWGQNAGAIGASGAISGLMAAAFRMLRVREPWLDQRAQPLTPILSRQVLTIAALWMGLNLVTGLVGAGPTGGFQSIAWQDHLGGFVAGLLLAGPFDRYFNTAARRAA
jgi:membrane associated rhomboid family serine protease